VCGLLNHYKDPNSCMFFEPMLLHPVYRKTCFSLQELCRAAICDRLTLTEAAASSFATPYEAVSALPLPKVLKDFLREYSYRHKIGSRQIEQRSRQAEVQR
jgi:suppressor of cytokine signaling 5